jgi:hypothetical protein
LRRVLLLGCGSSREKRLHIDGFGAADDPSDWGAFLVGLDSNEDHKPDVCWDLNVYPWPFEDGSFARIDAYEVIEHLGQQGDYKAFFAFFAEVYRILESGGYFAATCPSYRSIWAWGDPSHTRVITSGTLVFLDQDQYRQQVGRTAMSDFRYLWRDDFKAVWADVRAEERGEGLSFILQPVKPSRWEPAKIP